MKTIILTFASFLLTVTTFAQKYNPIMGAFSVKQPTCNASFDGEVAILPTGGLAPYSYIWSTGDTTQALYNLPAGVYSVSVTDALGQSLMGMVTLLDPAPVLIGGVITNTPLNVSNGAIDITNISGAVGEYTWTWSSNNDQVLNQATLDQVNLKAGNYKIAVTDANGCQGFGMFQVKNFVKPIINNTLPSISNTTTMAINVYPNPSNGNVTIEFENDVKEIVVKSATGRVIKTGSSNTTLVGLERGDYFIQYSNGVETQVKRFVVM